MKSILIICPYPHNVAPSQRFRFEQYLGLLEANNYVVLTRPFFTARQYETIYGSANSISKIATLARCLSARLLHLFQVPKFDLIFIHREATPVGPPIFEWVVAKVFRKRIIYDFDDAIWITDKKSEGILERLLRWRSKVRHICRWSWKVSCGNRYLASYARKYNPNVVVNPTTIDTNKVHNPALFNRIRKAAVTIGWTGSSTTLKYLEQLEQILQKLSDRFPNLEILVIADQPPRLTLKNVRFFKWSVASEVSDLANIDIGIMPMPDDEWTRGKCGFKALQYLALEIPAVVSNVGVNSEIVENGIEGYCCKSDPEWYSSLEKLVQDAPLRKEMGVRGRMKVIQRYSVESNASTFLSLFQ